MIGALCRGGIGNEHHLRWHVPLARLYAYWHDHCVSQGIDMVWAHGSTATALQLQRGKRRLAKYMRLRTAD